jgi:hypothetical protein
MFLGEMSMTFNIRQLDALSYDEGENLLEDYIDDAIDAFVDSQEGQRYIETHEEGGMWIETFLEFGYIYEEFTPSKMKVADVQLLMETIIPRKLMLTEPSQADDAIEELVSFWTFLKEDYQLKNANAIIKYLKTLNSKFPRLMNDPRKGGFLKSLLMEGMQEGFDIFTEEGLQAFREDHNAKLAMTSNSSPDPKIQSVKRSEKVPQKMQKKYEEIVKITDQFSAKYLNEEYAQLIREVTAALCRKRPSPLENGQAKSWACGITHAVGMVNFLYASSQTPYMKASELYQAFGVSSSTGQAKSKSVRDALEMSQIDPNWILPSRLESEPLKSFYSMLGEMGNLGL